MSSKLRWPWKPSSRRQDGGSAQPGSSASLPQLKPGAADKSQGLEVVSEGHHPVIDIVAVHGLNGHRVKTWTAANGVHWLRDLLPSDLPQARILCWGYNANTHASSRVSCHYLYDHARALVSDLCRKRRLTNSTKRPIVFVAHSLGGIIVKSALIHSDSSRQGALAEHRSIKLSTYGIIFMGTPHQGGNGVQLGRLFVNIASLFVAADDRVLRHLERDSEWLQQQLGQYGPISGEFVTKFAYEEYETPTALGHKIMVVPRVSAVVPGQADAEPIGIHADHVGMVRFPSNEDGGYITVSEHLQIMTAEAGDNIQSRWEAEARADEARGDGSPTGFSLPLDISEVTEVPRFVAREEELVQVHEILETAGGRRTAILQGLGGIGKTQLAIAYVKRHSTDYSAILWLNARDEITLKQSFARAAEGILRQHPWLAYIQNALENRDLSQIAQAVNRWLDEPKNHRWLLIYDNYDDPKLASSEAETSQSVLNKGSICKPEIMSQGFDIRHYLPSTFHGAVIVTTRSSAVQIGRRITLGKLKDISDGLEILVSTSHRQSLYDDDSAVKLAQKLDGLPLALSTAGAYLDQVTTSCDKYLQLYQESWLRLQKKSPQLLTYENRAMYSTWDISYEHIKKKNSNAAILLRFWAYFDKDDLWYELLRAGISAKDESDIGQWLRDLAIDDLCFDETMRVLCSHGLVEGGPPVEAESRGYSIHECVHSWMKHVLNPEVDVELARLAMRCVASHVPERSNPEYSWVQRRLVQHLDVCAKLMAHGVEPEEGKEWMIGNFGLLYKDQERLTDAEAMYERALRGKEKAWASECISNSTLKILLNLGNLYSDLGRLSEAEAVYKGALRGMEKTWGPEHTSTLGVVNNLGLLYAQQGRLTEAEATYERALRGYEKAWGPKHVSTLDTVNNLGNLYLEQARLTDAEVMFERALRGKEKAFGPEHVSTLATVNNLGNLYGDQNRLTDAEAMYERALQGFEKIWSPGHQSTLPTVNNLGNLYFDQGRVTDAEAMFDRALRGREKTLGPEHTSTLDVLNNLGVLYNYQGRFADAEAVYKRALQGYEKALGESMAKTYPPALDVLRNLAALLQKLGRLEEAQVYNIRAEAGVRIVYGTESEQYQRIISRMQPR